MLIKILSSKLKSLSLGLLVVCLSVHSAVLAESKTHSKEELEKRLAEIELHLKKNPHSIDALESKVATLELLGRSKEAVLICESEVKHGVNRVFIWRFLGLRKYRENRLAEALPFFNKAQSMGDASSAGVMAYCLRKLDRNEECLKFASEKIEQYPNESSLYLNRGLSRFTLKQSKTLVCADLWKASQLDPSVVGAYKSICSEEESGK